MSRCEAERRAVYEMLKARLPGSTRNRELLARLIATADCASLGAFRGVMEWERLRWLYEGMRGGDDPLELLERAREIICGCERLLP